MKRSIALGSLGVLLGAVVTAQAQSGQMETSKTSASNADLISELWFMEDATPIGTGQLDLRFTSEWRTGPSTGDGDNLIFQPSLVWGAYDNVELSVSVPAFVGDGGDAGPFENGNYDANIGMLWRLYDQVEYQPAVALSGTVRVPSGDNSDGVDGELRLVLTNDYDSGVRSHVNVWGRTVNNDERPDGRDFQYGASLGLDGPLCSDGAVRWVADYTSQAGPQDGFSDSHYVELGWEWGIDGNQSLGMSGQFSLDHQDEVADFGAKITYAYTLAR